jgi:MFS family permease
MNNNPAATSPGYRKTVLLLLTLVYGFNFIDRQIVGILAPFIQADLDLTNTQLGLLIGLAFAVLYTIVGIPIAYVADRINRVNVLTVSLALWSMFTALTGMAQNFWQIGLARMGVGIGEAGGSPPSHSIISDLYPKEERSSALGIYSLGIPLGIMAAYFASASLMGKNPTEVNWRRILITLGVAGVVLSLILKLVLKEPVRGAQEIALGGSAKRESFGTNLKTLLSIKSWWYMCLGIATASFCAYSFSGFQTKFLRLLDPTYDFRQLVIYLGFINGIAYVSGTYFGARLADKLGKKSVRAYGWLPALAVGIAFPIAVFSFWVGSVNMHLIFAALLLTALGFYLGPSFAIAQTLAPIHMRAMSTALFFFILNMIALGGGPTVTGILIDHFSKDNTPLYATQMSMSLVCIGFAVSVICFLMAAKNLPEDWANAEKRNEAT